jgi:exopolysaccharide production protein ExoZ
MARTNDSQLDAIQALRALAASSVCVGHTIYETRLYAGRDALASVPHLPWAAGVDVFFIISGFIMMHTFGARFAEPGAPWSFMERRLLRIVPSYWFFTTALVIVAMLLPGKLDSTKLTTEHAVLSYLFIPHLAPGERPTIHPLFSLGWTLVYEMFFYLCFSLALRLRRTAGLTALLGGFIALHIGARLGLFGTALGMFFGDTILFEFLVGIGLYLLSERGRLSWPQSLACAAIGAVGFAVHLALGVQGLRLFGYGMLGLAVFGLGVQLPSRTRAGWMAALVLLGDASYALYLSHPFTLEAIELVAKRLVPRVVVEQPWFAAGYFLLCYVGTHIAAVVFYKLAERPVTSWLNSRVRGARASGALVPSRADNASPGR